MHILIIEDEEKIARFIELELKHEGYTSEKERDGRKGLELAENGSFDLILLDVMLPGLNGIEILRRLRKSKPDLPVIMLTARDAVMDKVGGLDMGANDYITKPFAIEELLARIRVILRNTSPKESEQATDDTLRFGQLSLCPKRHEVRFGEEIIELTSREFALLQSLLENKNIVLGRTTLLERVWGYDYIGETNVVDVYIRYLRTKIDERFDIKMIQTVRSVGYVIKEDV